MTIDDKQYLVDVGFGFNSIRIPIAFDSGRNLEVITPQEEQYQLRYEGDHYVLSMMLKNKWCPFYRFNHPLSEIDALQTMNNYKRMMAFEGTVPIRDLRFILGRLTEEGREGSVYEIAQSAKEKKAVAYRFATVANEPPRKTSYDENISETTFIREAKLSLNFSYQTQE